MTRPWHTLRSAAAMPAGATRAGRDAAGTGTPCTDAPVVGIRLPALFVSGEAWTRGHAAAIVPMACTAIVCIALTSLMAAIPSFADVGTGLVLILLLAGVVIAAFRASRAARRV